MTFWFPLRNNNGKLKIIQEIEQNQMQKALEVNYEVMTKHGQMPCNYLVKLKVDLKKWQVLGTDRF